MESSPPESPVPSSRPQSAMVRTTPRSSSRLSTSSRIGPTSAATTTTTSNNRTVAASDDELQAQKTAAVKVVVRVRPPLQPSDPGFDLIPQRFQRAMVHVTTPTSVAIDSPQGRKLFVFDRVFPESTTQAGVWDYLHDCINSFIQGYNVSLLAYGQSGAGKSYTMGTAASMDSYDHEAMGVIPRAAIALFEKLEAASSGIAALASQNRSSMSRLQSPSKLGLANLAAAKERPWTLRATYVEIYNETLRDLLVPENTPAHERSHVMIREDVKGNILLTGLRQLEINSVEDLMKALAFGSAIRQTDATAINAKSSRSHAVFSLNLVQRRNKSPIPGGGDKRCSMPADPVAATPDGFVATDSKLHFVDLAGSERLKNTGAQGERAKEGISINAGLAALGKVISQLSTRTHNGHISYRDSKLTRLLQDSLGGSAVTYMIACVTPAEFHLSETLNTVQYAQRARAIQSKPRVQTIDDPDNKDSEIKRLQVKIMLLEGEIEQMRQSGGGAGAATGGGGGAGLKSTTIGGSRSVSGASGASTTDLSFLRNQMRDSELGDLATERLDRSISLAQAAQNALSEHETTIQTLDLRLREMVDRESDAEKYLRYLESRVDGHTIGSYIEMLEADLAEANEKNHELGQLVRQQHSLLQQSSHRQLTFLMNEFDHSPDDNTNTISNKNEHGYGGENVMRDDTTASLATTLANGSAHSYVAQPSDDDLTAATFHEARVNGIDNETQTEAHSINDTSAGVGTTGTEDAPTEDASRLPQPLLSGDGSSAQSTSQQQQQQQQQRKFATDKLGHVTQELHDLHAEHEASRRELEALHAKYVDAVKTIAELQDEAQHSGRTHDSMLSASSPPGTRPSSFMSNPSHGAQFSSRSLSSELSSAMVSPVTAEASDTDTITCKPMAGIDHVVADSSDAALANARHANARVVSMLDNEQQQQQQQHELQLQNSKLVVAAEKEAQNEELAKKYAELESEHQETLAVVEELKAELMRAKSGDQSQSQLYQQLAVPGSVSSGTPVIRRKSSQMLAADRAHRPFTILRDIATRNLAAQPDVMHSFELNLNAAIHELHLSSERIRELKADIANGKKEMEAKSAIISGLTRERTSLQAATRVDISVALQSQLEQMRDAVAAREKEVESQVERMREEHEKELELRAEQLHESHAREKELESQIEQLRMSFRQQEHDEHATQDEDKSSNAPVAATAAAGAGTLAGAFLGAIGMGRSNAKQADHDVTDAASQHERIAYLESELAAWKERSESALASMQETEATLKNTIHDLEQQLNAANQQLQDTANFHHASESSAQEVEKQMTLVKFLRAEVDEYKAIINSNASKVAQVEQAYAQARAELQEAVEARDAALVESKAHEQLVASFQTQILRHDENVQMFEDKLVALHEQHAKNVEQVEEAAREAYEQQLQALMEENAENIKIFECDLNDAREALTRMATQVAQALGVEVSVEKLPERIDRLVSDHKLHSHQHSKLHAVEAEFEELVRINAQVVRELEMTKSGLKDLVPPSVSQANNRKPPQSVADYLAIVKEVMMELETRNHKNSRIVEELEQQLTSTWEQAQISTRRMSNLTERTQQLDDVTQAKVNLQRQLETLREEYAMLQAKYYELQGNQKRTGSVSSNLRKSGSAASLPSPPPSVPLPPIPGVAASSSVGSSAVGGGVGSVGSVPGARPPSSKGGVTTLAHIPEDQDGSSVSNNQQEARIRSMERHLQAEKQLTATLEEALTDLENQSVKAKAEADAWRQKCRTLEDENKQLREQPQVDSRWSLQQVEEERKKRLDAEMARARMEERMAQLNVGKKKKKGSLNCF